MPSQWDTIAIPFVGGIDTKSDAKAAPVAKLVSLENGVFTKRGSIRKRHGYTKVAPLLTGGTAISLEAIASYKRALAGTGAVNLYSFNEEQSYWEDAGYFNHVELSSEAVEASSQEQTQGDQCEYNNILVRAYYVGTTLYIYVYDATTKTRVNYITVASTSNVRVVRTGNYIQVMYALSGSTDLSTIPINTLRPSEAVAGDALVIASDMHADSVFDAVTSSTGEDALFAWYSTGGNTLRYGRLLASGSTENKRDHGTTAAISVISVAASADVFVIGYQDTTNGRPMISAVSSPNGNLAAVINTLTLNALLTAVKLTVGATSDSWFCLFHATHSSTPWLTETTLKSGSTDASTGLGSASTGTLFGLDLASEAFTDEDRAYVWFRYDGALGLQGSYFLYHLNLDGSDWRPRVVGKVQVGNATSATETYRLPSFSASGTSKKGLLPRRRKVVADEEGAFMHEGLAEVEFNSVSTAYEAEEYGESLYYPGGFPWMYDGKEPVEAGFLLYPEPNVDLGSTDPADHTDVSVAGSGSLGAGVRSYRVYYEWFSASGELHRSTSVPFSVNVPASNDVTLTLPTLTPTLRGDGVSNLARSHVSIAVYRTAVNGSVYYKVSGTDPATVTGDNRYVFNDLTAATVEFVDSMTDAVAAKKEIDPNTGGLLDNVAGPACTSLTATQKRLFAAGGDIPENQVAFTKLKLEGFPAEFNETLYLELPNRGGVVTALATLNDTLVVFKKNHILGVTGDGPNNFDVGEYFPAQELTTDVGCVDKRSLVETPDGLMFQSVKGIYLLDRSFSVSYVGAEAELFNDETIVSAELVADQNIVIFLSSDNRTLVYDYLFRQWSTFTNHTGLSATVWEEKYCYLKSDSTLFIQSTSRYTDGGNTYRLKLKTAPIRIDALQQFWRCKRTYVLGEYFSDHKLRMNLWFNREAAPQEAVTWDPSDFIDDTKWGDGTTWGDLGAVSQIVGGDLLSGPFFLAVGATEITVTSTEGYPSSGRLLLTEMAFGDTEEIAYSSLDATTFYLDTPTTISYRLTSIGDPSIVGTVTDLVGTGAVWGGDIAGRDYQMSYAPARQKVQSVSFEFEEVPGVQPGRAFELTELAILWAPHTGLGRIEAARRK